MEGAYLQDAVDVVPHVEVRQALVEDCVWRGVHELEDLGDEEGCVCGVPGSRSSSAGSGRCRGAG